MQTIKKQTFVETHHHKILTHGYLELKLMFQYQSCFTNHLSPAKECICVYDTFYWLYC